MSQLMCIEKLSFTYKLLSSFKSYSRKLCILSILAATTPALAAPALPDELISAIRSAVQTHPDVMVADARMLSASSQVTAGSYRWYPRAEVSIRTGEQGDRYSTIGLNQTLAADTNARVDTIDLGTGNGLLIHGYQVEGNWYYHWDRDASGTSSGDTINHDLLDSTFIYNSNFSATNPGANTTETYRFANINGIQLALPTYGSTVDGSGNANNIGFQPGTAVSGESSGSNANPTYNDLLAVWDAFNGTSTNIKLDGSPAGWGTNPYPYLSATSTTTGSIHAALNMITGQTVDFNDSITNAYAALQVV